MRPLFRTLAVLVTALVALADLRLYRGDVAAADVGALTRAVEPQLRYLEVALHDGAPARAQRRFPEGYVFTWAFAGLAAAELAMALPTAAPEYRAALDLAWEAADAVDSAAGRAPFDAALSPPYGVFHAGWSAQLQAGALLATPPRQRDVERVAALGARCDAIGSAFDGSENPWLPSYPAQSWPVDGVVAMAALRHCETVLDAAGAERARQRRRDYSATRARWLEQARAHVHPVSGLIPHTADSFTGRPTSAPRATSLALALRFLHDVDPAWGAEHYEGLRSRFLVSRLAVPGLAEHAGAGGAGDVDSGPLVAGVSLPATAIGAGVARLYGDDALAGAMLDAGELLGMPLTWQGRKRYLLGRLPVADGMAAWARTARPWGAPPVRPAAAAALPVPAWRLPLHLVSALAVALAWLPVVRGWLKGPRW